MHVDLKLSISPSKEGRPRVSANRAMKEIFGFQKEAVKKGWGEKCIKIFFFNFKLAIRKITTPVHKDGLSNF